MAARTITRRTLVTIAIAIGLLAVDLVSSLALACNVPVYRYALDHWHPDPYRAVLFHRGSLSDSERERLASLQTEALSGSLNLSIRTVDVSAAVERDDEGLLAATGSDDLPRLVLQYPKHLEMDQPVWSGEFSAEKPGDTSAISKLIDSPLRQEILQRLSKGQTSVWLMVDSGQAEQNEAAARTLQQELKKLEHKLELPTLTDAPEDAIQGGPDLRIEFSLLRVRRDEPKEQALLAMLLGCEADLMAIDEPIVFPIFGRSRVLLPLVGGGISPENIHNSSAFLVGACSCQVKELNPGFDLLVTANWNELLDWIESPTKSSANATELVAREPKLLTIPSGAKASTLPESVAQSAAAPEPATASPRAFSQNSAVRALPIFFAVVVGGVVLVVLRRAFRPYARRHK